jgi:outer membrane receptor protein involved in Fe transport
MITIARQQTRRCHVQHAYFKSFRQIDTLLSLWKALVLPCCGALDPRSSFSRVCSASILAASLGMMSSSAHAQSAASVSGTVSDTRGGVVPNAQVVITNIATNVEQETVTSSAGTYSVINVAPGNYTVKVTKAGFSTQELNNLTLEVNQAASFNFTLAPGTVSQSVTVNAESATIESTTAELGAVIGAQPVNNLPLNGRNFTELLELTPGVSRVSVGQNSGGGGGFAGQATGTFTFPSVNGQRNRSNMFLLDGVTDLGSFIGNYNYQPIVDDIQEFKVQSHNDLAEFGQVTGGIVNVVTKSGTNSLHGTVWEFLRNSAFDARDYFLPSVNPLRQNVFGATAGGPILIPKLYNGRNKTFFFFAYEGFRQDQAAQNIDTTPTAAQLGGDFSNLLAKGVVIYNPFTTAPDSAHPGSYTRQPFPNNQIPTNLLNPAALLYAKTLFPAPNAALAGGQNLIDTTPTIVDTDSYSGRIDQSFGEHDQIFGRISAYGQNSSGSNGYPGFAVVSSLYGYNMVVHESHTFNPTSILELYFGRNIGDDLTQATFPKAPSGFATSLINAGFSTNYISGFLSQSAPFIPLIGAAGYLGPGTGDNNLQDTQIANTYEYGGSFTKVLSRNTIKAGAVYQSNNSRSPISGASEASSAFQTSNLENPTSASGAATGDAMASLLLGDPTSAQRRDVLETEHHGQVDGAFVQDQIQLSQKLALNVGVRWDVSVWPIYGNTLADGQGYVGDIDLTNGTYLLSAVPAACSTTVGAPCIPGGALPADVIQTPFANRALHKTDFSNWQPRVGIAYHPLEKTSILAGYSRFYDEWNSVVQYSQNAGGNWPSVSELNQNTLNTTSATAPITNPLSQSSGVTIAPSATPFTQTAYYFDPYFKTPYTDQWNLQVEQGLGSSTVFTLAYSGSHSDRLDLGGLYNTAQTPGPGDAATVASRQQFPYITPTNYDKSSGNANYNALQTSLKRSTSKGLTYLFSYTWSKSIDLASSGSFGSEGTLLQNPYDPQADRSVSGYDLTNIFSASANYRLPIGKGLAVNLENPLVNSLLGGWATNAIVTLTSGTPYSVTVNGDIANVGNTFVQADLVGNPNPTTKNATTWLNPEAFSAPPAYSFGTFGRNALRSQGYNDFDFSIFKSFALPRDTSVEFRAESFNLLNTVVFSAPDSTVTDPTFGAVSSIANSPRQLQFALKIQF